MVQSEGPAFPVFFVYEIGSIFIEIIFAVALPCHNFRIDRIGGEIQKWNGHQRIQGEQKDASSYEAEGDVPATFRVTEIFERDKCSYCQCTENQVLEQRLPMSEMNYFTETTAIHIRIEDEKKQRNKSKETDEYCCNVCNCFSPYSCYKASPDQCLCQRQCHCDGFGGEIQEREVEKFVIALDYQAG